MQRDDFADFANVHFDKATCRTYIILKIEYDLSLNKTWFFVFFKASLLGHGSDDITFIRFVFYP